MPKVEQYKSGITTGVAQAPKARSISQDTGAGFVMKGLADLGQGLAQFQDRVDTTEAEEAVVNFEREKNKLFYEQGTGYFNSQGKVAFDGAKNASDALDKLKKTYSEKLSQGARDKFDKVANVHVTRGNASIMQHAAKGMRVYELATIEAGVENAIENAALYRNDPDLLREQKIIGEQGIYEAAALSGIGPEATAEKVQTFRSSFAKTTIAAATADGSAAGREALDKYGDMLEGPDKVKVEAAIQKKEKTEKTETNALQSLMVANKLVNQYDKWDDINNEVNKIKDVELQDQTRTEARQRFNMEKAAKTERQADSYNVGIDHLNNGGTVASFKAANARAWENMTSTQRNNLSSGKHNITDQVELNRLLSLPADEMAKVDVNKYAERFKPSDLTKLRSAKAKAEKGETYTTVPATKINAVAKQFYGLPSTWKKNKREKVNDLMRAAQERLTEFETDKKGDATPVEIDQVLAEFSHSIVLEDQTLWFDETYNLKDVPAREMSAMNRTINELGEASADSVIQLREFLIKNKVPITYDNLQNAYEQAKR